MTLGFVCVLVVRLVLAVEQTLCHGWVNTGKAVVFSAVSVCFPVLETSGTGAVYVEELVTRLPAARSAKVKGPNLYWAVM
jgi:hypothetical protein